MTRTLKLLLPALIPKWNFFNVIGASPRIEYTLLKSPEASPGDWLEFRPRPKHIPLPSMVRRLFWNAGWNETMFVVSCAERLLDEPTEHSQNEIFRRIAADFDDCPEWNGAWLRFRIALLSENENAIAREIAFVSDPRRVVISSA